MGGIKKHLKKFEYQLRQETNIGKILAWIVWLVVVGTSGYAGLILLAFGLSAPDHAVAAHIATQRTAVVVGGLAVPFVVSLGFMVMSKFGFGLLFALLMLPFMFGIGLMFGM